MTLYINHMTLTKAKVMLEKTKLFAQEAEVFKNTESTNTLVDDTYLREILLTTTLVT